MNGWKTIHSIVETLCSTLPSHNVVLPHLWAQKLVCKQHCERRVCHKSFRSVYSCTVPRNFVTECSVGPLKNLSPFTISLPRVSLQILLCLIYGTEFDLSIGATLRSEWVKLQGKKTHYIYIHCTYHDLKQDLKVFCTYTDVIPGIIFTQAAIFFCTSPLWK